MNVANKLKQFIIPTSFVTAYFLVKYKAKVSPKSEVDISSNFRIGKGAVISSFCKVKANGPLDIGENVSIGAGCFISSDKGGVTIGKYTMVGPNTSIVGNNYSYDDLEVPVCLQDKTSSGIVIGRNVWIGAGCVILDGSQIGDDVIISPNSVVSTALQIGAIAQGNPAKAVFIRR